MLEPDTFNSPIEIDMLASIYICYLYIGKKLMGRRRNQLLKDEWFTPVGKVFKNESWLECILRVVGSKLGLTIRDPSEFELMSAWDHLNENIVLNENISTRYVDLPYYYILE